MAGLAAGAAAGLVAVAISEALLALWRRRPDWSPLAVAFSGVVLRSLWMAAALLVGLASDWSQRPLFVMTLLAVYLAAQVFEGLRFQRFAETR